MERAPSTILARLGHEIGTCLGGARPAPLLEGARVQVEAVVPRRIAGFRVRIAAPGGAAVDEGLLRRAAELVGRASWVARCVAVPPSLYLDPDRAHLNALLSEELTPARGFGHVPDPARTGRRVSLAFCSPNANKPLHLGHARNMLLGVGIGNLLELAGARVVRSCCVSDYGVHVSKALAAYLRYGDGATPESAGEKGDRFVGRFYARFPADRSLADGPGSPRELTALWMAGDERVRELTRRLTGWAEAGFDETFASFGVRYDRRFREVDEHVYIERFVAEQRARGAVHEDDEGRLVVHLGGDPPEVVALARSDGSPLYMSHMVAAILQRLEVLAPVDALVTLTGEEQVVPFAQLRRTLARFGYAQAVELRHLTHGLVYADGRGLSSRDGTELTIDAVVDELAQSRSMEAARAVLALYVLSRPMDKALHYSRDACVATGTRLLADVAATLAAALPEPPGALAVRPPAFARRTDDARLGRFAARLATYPLALDRAATGLDPTLLANHAFALCRDFVLLLRAAGSADRAPRGLAELFPPTHRVVDHALRTLGLDPDRLAALDLADRGARARTPRRAPERSVRQAAGAAA